MWLIMLQLWKRMLIFFSNSSSAIISAPFLQSLGMVIRKSCFKQLDLLSLSMQSVYLTSLSHSLTQPLTSLQQQHSPSIAAMLLELLFVLLFVPAVLLFIAGDVITHSGLRATEIWPYLRNELSEEHSPEEN